MSIMTSKGNEFITSFFLIFFLSFIIHLLLSFLFSFFLSLFIYFLISYFMYFLLSLFCFSFFIYLLILFYHSIFIFFLHLLIDFLLSFFFPFNLFLSFLFHSFFLFCLVAPPCLKQEKSWQKFDFKNYLDLLANDSVWSIKVSFVTEYEHQLSKKDSSLKCSRPKSYSLDRYVGCVWYKLWPLALLLFWPEVCRDMARKWNFWFRGCL